MRFSTLSSTLSLVLLLPAALAAPYPIPGNATLAIRGNAADPSAAAVKRSPTGAAIKRASISTGIVRRQDVPLATGVAKRQESTSAAQEVSNSAAASGAQSTSAVQDASVPAAASTTQAVEKRDHATNAVQTVGAAAKPVAKRDFVGVKRANATEVEKRNATVERRNATEPARVLRRASGLI